MGFSKDIYFKSTLVFAEGQTTLVRIRKVIKKTEQIASKFSAINDDTTGFKLAAYNEIKSIIKQHEDDKFI